MNKIQDQIEKLYQEEEEALSNWIRFFNLLFISVIVATLGLYRNSGAVVIAAMLLAPLMTPILGIAAAIVMGRMHRLFSHVLAVLIASLGTVALSFFIMFLFDVPLGLALPDQVIARTNPGLEELGVALAAGIAGSYVQIRKEEAGMLPGVAIGVSLVPPLSAAGILYYYSQPLLAWEAIILFITNLAAIILSACTVFFLLGVKPERRDRALKKRVTLGTAVSLITVFVLALDLGNETMTRFHEARTEERVLSAIENWRKTHPVEISDVAVDGDTIKIRLIFDVPLNKASKIAAPADLISLDLNENVLANDIQRILKRNIKIIFSGQLRFTGIIEVKNLPGSQP